MPMEMFLKLAGIEGESTDAKHKGEIDVLAWSWGLSNEASAGPGGGTGGGAGRAKIENISINKSVDLASPLLLSFGAKGQHIKEGTLTTRRSGTAGNEFLLLKMTNVVVTSVHVAADQTVPSENVTLSFGKIEFVYRATKPTGAPGAEKIFTWDVAQGKPF
jgi:type VI secretion system secreted protein Hcp